MKDLAQKYVFSFKDIREEGASVIHVLTWDEKFVPSFVNLARREFSRTRQVFIVCGLSSRETTWGGTDVILCENASAGVKELKLRQNKFEKIIFHGLFYTEIIIFLLFKSNLLKRSGWVIWGGDLYFKILRRRSLSTSIVEVLRTVVINRIAVISTTVPGDFALVKKWYGSKAVFIQNLMYESHVARVNTGQSPASDTGSVTIQVGNSADPSNHHESVLRELKKSGVSTKAIYVPLAYGDRQYAEKIIRVGRELFGDKLIPILEMQTPEEYNRHLSQIDIALFGHKRQQGMGNIIALLSLGKKVYLRSDVTSWDYLTSLDIFVFDVLDLSDLRRLDIRAREHNIRRCRDIFSYSKLVEGWRKVLEYKSQ
jgi:hypothetical protein